MRFSLLTGLIVGGLFFASPAQAADDGLQWSWDGDVKRQYLLRSQVLLPEFMQFNKEHNRDARVTEFLVSVITTCQAVVAIGKDKHELKCVIDDFAIAGAPPQSDQGKLKEIFDEVDGKLVNGGWMQLIVTNDGRITDQDLEGVDKSNSRNRSIHEVLRQVLGRLFASMDLQLPRKGVDPGSPWQQKSSPLAMHFPSEFGTFGSTDVTHQINSNTAGKVEITTTGRGSLGPAEFISVRTGSDRLKNTYDLSYRGVTVFDTKAGTMIEHEYLVEGMPTPSSMAAEGGEGVGYVQMTRLELIPEGSKAPNLGPNEEIDPTRQYASGIQK